MMAKLQRGAFLKETCDPSPSFQSAMSLLVVVCCCCGPITVSAILVFDSTALLNEVLIPADAAVGSVIYRLRSSDSSFDYPLLFDIQDTAVVAVEALNCTRFNSVCQANLILKKKLEPGRFYDFRVEVRNQRGQRAVINCSFQATNATTPIEKIFPGAPTLLTVSENAGKNTDLGTVIAKGNPHRMKAVILELYGTVQFGIHQKLISEKDAEGTIVLLNRLDYETKTVHHLTILANDPWTNMAEDTRNIAGWPLLVAVIDEQDTPPIFTIAPPTTTLSPTLSPGDTILKVHAEDGDRGQPRPIRYSLNSADPASSFFHINEKTGDLLLALPVPQIVSFPNQGQPILVKVTAEEVRQNPQEPPSQSTTVQLALIPPGITLGSPTFGSIEYHALLDENSPAGTMLDLPQAEISTEPGDVITLELNKNNGTFEVSPSVVEGFSKFRIAVHDNRLLDYEARRYVECYIVAKELGKGNYSARAKLTVVLRDMNDNPPQFVKSEFTGSVPEHAIVGTTVLIVEAADIDREPGSKIRYVDLLGPGSDLFTLEPDTGLITVANSANLDAETYPKIVLEVRAADENGEGLSATSKVTITLLDINDNIPQFEKDVYEFILNTDRRSFTTQAFVKALDGDLSPPNNEVRYQLLTPNEDLFLDERTGEILVKKSWEPDELVTLKVKAYDEGVPRLSSDAEVRIYPPEPKSRKMIFIVPGKYPDKSTIERTLSAVTGGSVVVDEIRPYTGFEPEAAYVTRDLSLSNKSVVIATIHYTKDSVVDLKTIQRILDDNPPQVNWQPNQNSITQEKELTTIKQSSSSDLYWILILLIALAILTAIILILCCICRPCPLYIPPKRKKVRSADMVERLFIKGSGHGRETKSVQVAEWFGRKEAWSSEKVAVPVMVDAETDSLRRHEMERGSERGGIRQSRMRHQHLLQQSQSMQQLNNQQDHAREQLYFREGNADILRLVTRSGTEAQRNGTVFVDQNQQHFLVDNGKDILMRRYIDQQQAEAARTQVLLPNAVNKLQSEQEFLEASLRQQNALLRQLILEKERDLRLETQSLPAGACIMSIGTQTDQDMSTQTEPQYLRPPRRRVQSDWEMSDDGSDEEIAIIKARAKRRHRVMKPRKIRTPILEESEVEILEKYEKPFKQSISVDKGSDAPPKIKQTRTSQLRQKRANSDVRVAKHSKSRVSKSALKREVLKEISASLNQSEESDSYYENDRRFSDQYSDDSLEDISPQSEKTTDSGKHKRRSQSSEVTKSRRSESLDQGKRKTSSNRSSLRRLSTDSNEVKQQRYRSESDLRALRDRKPAVTAQKSQSHADLSSGREKNDKKSKKPAAKRTSRYMEWYNKKKQSSESQEQASTRRKSDASLNVEKVGKNTVNTRLCKETVASSSKKVDNTGKKQTTGPDHPLLQHSEYRYEIQYPKKRPEEDADSGIVLTKPEMAQKKSIFTIAYNDMHTQQLRPDSSANTP
ncbi:cadherin-86C [Euwallacea fornicatus]|uniref:cadherin-86C n=1 Tax=Euwallacea fornicatus TaxID=995702 RepID=UPI0033904C9E